MAIELCVLASGSAGNCAAIRTPTGVLLIDAGIGPRIVSQRLAGTGISLSDVSAICLTHLDRDHFSYSWMGTIVRRKIRVFCHAERVADVLAAGVGHVADGPETTCFESLVVGFAEGTRFEPLPGLAARAVRLAHDDEGSHGFILDGFDRRVGYLTDLGHFPARVLPLFCGVDVLAIESNYDAHLQQGSARPWFLKQRITGGRGHLSNQEAFDAVRRIFDRCDQCGHRRPEHVVLLHRSRECNCPDLLRSLFDRDPRIGPRVTLAEQYSRTEWIRPRGDSPLVGEQLRLAWG